MERDIKNHFSNPVIKSDVRSSTDKMDSYWNSIPSTFSRSSKNEEAYTDISLFSKGKRNKKIDRLFGN